MPYQRMNLNTLFILSRPPFKSFKHHIPSPKSFIIKDHNPVTKPKRTAMAPKLPQTLTFLLTLTATTIVHAQNVTSCAELGCGANTKTCTLTNETYPLIGVAPILPSSSSSLPVSLSWVQGTRANDNTGLNNTWFDTFYLASPPPSSDTATNLQGGCALFFRTFNAAFPGGADASITTGTCTDAIRQECIDALTARAQDVDVDGEDDVCDALKKEFEEGTIDNACAEYAVDNAHNWKDLRVQCKFVSCPWRMMKS